MTEFTPRLSSKWLLVVSWKALLRLCLLYIITSKIYEKEIRCYFSLMVKTYITFKVMHIHAHLYKYDVPYIDKYYKYTQSIYCMHIYMHTHTHILKFLWPIFTFPSSKILKYFLIIYPNYFPSHPKSHERPWWKKPQSFTKGKLLVTIAIATLSDRSGHAQANRNGCYIQTHKGLVKDTTEVHPVFINIFLQKKSSSQQVIEAACKRGCRCGRQCAFCISFNFL